jgi:hypothetical protein
MARMAMNKSNKTLMLEIRTILHVLQGLVAGKGSLNEDMPMREMSYFLNMVRDRVDLLSHKLQNSGQLH